MRISVLSLPSTADAGGAVLATRKFFRATSAMLLSEACTGYNYCSHGNVSLNKQGTGIQVMYRWTKEHRKGDVSLFHSKNIKGKQDSLSGLSKSLHLSPPVTQAPCPLWAFPGKLHSVGLCCSVPSSISKAQRQYLMEGLPKIALRLWSLFIQSNMVTDGWVNLYTVCLHAHPAT